MALRRTGKGYGLGVSATHPFNPWIGKPKVSGTGDKIAQSLDASTWQRLPAGEGTKSPGLTSVRASISAPVPAVPVSIAVVQERDAVVWTEFSCRLEAVGRVQVA